MEAGPSAKEEHEPPAKAAEEAAEEAAEVAGVVRVPSTIRHEAAMTPRSATSYLSHLRHLRAAPHASVHPWEDR